MHRLESQSLVNNGSNTLSNCNDLPPWQQNIFSSMMAAIGRQLKQSVNVFHSFMLYRRLPDTTSNQCNHVSASNTDSNYMAVNYNRQNTASGACHKRRRIHYHRCRWMV